MRLQQLRAAVAQHEEQQHQLREEGQGTMRKHGAGEGAAQQHEDFGASEAAAKNQKC